MPNGLMGLRHHEAAGGIVMMIAAILAIVLNNSRFLWIDDSLLATHVSIRVGTFALDKSLLHWINDGLMAIFFFLVGLELKKEVMSGALSSFDRAVLPAIGAFGGMVAPALIYLLVNRNNAAGIAGWAIPSATDIAFAVAVLTMVGNRVPSALKVFLLALAIIDDLGAIVIIAGFYTSDLSALSLAWAGAGCAVLAILNRSNVTRPAPYLLVGLFIWVCVLKSGVHATLAGVLVAIAIPMTRRNPRGDSLLSDLETSLHPWVTFGVLPIFAFANAGVSLAGVTFDRLFAPIPLGIALGLFVGKTIGITGAVWLAALTGVARLPAGVTWAQMIAVSVLAGIGFTMSIFIGMLAFPDPAYGTDLRVGVLVGSLLSAICGYGLLRLTTRPPQQQSVA